MPPSLLAAGLAGGGRIVLAQPRRVAARAAARRIAEEHGWQVGGEVGYRLRYERLEGASTAILAVTEGLLAQMLLGDPLLDGVGALIFDEIHERNLDGDLGLALALEVQATVRRDLRIVAMSATLQAGPLARLLGDCPLVESEGRLHPVEVEYQPSAAGSWLAPQVAAAVRRILPQTGGDVLAFLPGVGEIAATEAALSGLAGIDVLPLHGSLPAEQQDRALRRGERRRVVLATNVAETSVTVEGVSAVVDAGWQRQLRFQPGAGVDRLELKRISRASATQRAGRAGRQGPGLCVRLWSEAEHRGLLERDTPEIERVDLAAAVLRIRSFGEADASRLAWLDPPSPGRVAAAEQLLTGLGALGPHGVTRDGRVICALPLHPRLGRLAVTAWLGGAPRLGCLAAALLAEGDVVERGATMAPSAGESDVLDRLAMLQGRPQRGFGAGLHRGRAAAVRRSARDVERRLQLLLGRPPAAPEAESQSLCRALLAAYPDRLARRRAPGSDRAVMVGGRGLRIAAESVVRTADLLLAVEISGRGGQRGEDLVRLAVAVEPEWVEDRIVEEVVLRFDPAAQRVRTLRLRRVGDLTLEEREVETPRTEQVAEVLRVAAEPVVEQALGLARPDIAPWLRRVRWLAGVAPELGLPRYEEATLRAELPVLCAGRRSFAELAALPLPDLLGRRLSWQQQRELERQAPTHLLLPSGRRAPLDYRDEGPPVLAARIQELFGWKETPRIAGGRVPLLLHLLAPNRRPQQVTDDLASFWSGAYVEVRRELRGRYPKHAWPEDPRVAEPRPARRPR